MPEHTIVSVALNLPLFRFFDYLLEGSYDESVIGSRVQVSFGRTVQTGIVTAVKQESELDLKDLKTAKLIDASPLIESDMFETLEFGSRYYHYPLGQCLHTAMPKLLREGEAASYKSIPGLELIDRDFDENTLRSEEQKRIVRILRHGTAKRLELRERGIKSASENALVKKNIIRKVDISPRLVPFEPDRDSIIRQPGPELNPDQVSAVKAVCGHEGFGVFLINGVTGSGKTEVYLNIIEDVIRQGKKAMVLVPEIALTPQTFERFYNRFNVPIASMHSSLSDRERCDAYLDMRYEKAWIIIGTRSSLFAPVKNLGLIVIDEEHDSSFKQNDGFRYHARSLAIVRAKIHGAKVVLGSATPSLESIHNCQIGKFTALYLPERAGGAAMPGIELIDLRAEGMSDGIRTGIGQTLEQRIGLETAKGNQVLLFLNRRGYSHNLICHNCGHVFMCRQCDIPLTVHKGAGRLCCHICDSFEYIPQACPKCRSDMLLESGFGTEQVEEFLRLRYPDTAIVRVDRDNIKNRDDLEESLQKIVKKEAQILVGTQMLAKGHDFPDVTLVGILDIDANLYSDDFRSLESTAQLVTQVSGRAGRAFKKGSVVIQSHEKNHRLIYDLVVSKLGYAQIAQELLGLREAQRMPPFSYMAFLLSNCSVREYAYEYLQGVHAYMHGKYADEENFISPVVSDKIEKRQNRFHFHILLKSTHSKRFHEILDDVSQSFMGDRKLKGDCRFAVEVDPNIMY